MSSNITILLAEDNPDHAELIMRNLEEFKTANHVNLVEDGEAVLDYLHHRGSYTNSACFPTPNLILLDLRLPKIDGLEVLKAIKSDNALLSIPVVILTSSEAEADMAKAYEYHANSYLVKPIAFEKFVEMLKEIGCYWISWNRQTDM